MDDLYALPDHDIAENGEEGEHGGEGRLAVNDEEGDMVDFEAIGEVADPRTAFIGVGYDDDFVPAVDELGGELVDV